jgi:serine phosphatase RsbU (regulator of sigma subunit)/HD-like signal output (HDOD) protein
MPSRPSIETVSPADLPIPPEGAFLIIHACNQENVDAQKLGQLLEKDPVLSIELLRIANSAFFGFSGKITTVSRAVTVIGQRSLRHLVLCVAMRDALKPEQLPALSVEAFWTTALTRAVCARTLARRAGLDSDIAFTVGLLQDFGLLVLFYLYPNRIAEWPELAELAPDERYEMERQLFETTHDRVGGQLAESWKLPDVLRLSMATHHHLPVSDADEDTTETDTPYCRLAQCADWMAAVFNCTDKRHALGRSHALLQAHFAINGSETDRLLENISSEVGEAARAFGFELQAQPPFEEILQQANLRLVEDNLSIQEINWQLAQVLDERDRMAAELKQELDLAREVQRSLLPAETQQGAGAHGVNLSAKAVSGDFYDFYRLHDGRTAFCIADVSGKGMNAALLMAKASSLFHCLGKSIHNPAKLLGMINRELVETAIHGMFITLVAGVIDPQTSQVTLCNAGHLPVLRLRGKQVIERYPADSPPLGILADSAFENRSLELGNDTLYLYTDGLLEARLADGRRQDQPGLERLFARHAERPPVQRLQHIVAALRPDQGEVADDMTLLLIEAQP